MRAHIEIVRDVPGTALVIRDVGLPGNWYERGLSPAMSVTNDVEGVVQHLRLKGLLPDGRQLFYYDTAGDLDEIVVEGGAFARFNVGPR